MIAALGQNRQKFRFRFLSAPRRYKKIIITWPALSQRLAASPSTHSRYHRRTPFRHLLADWQVKFLVDFYDFVTGSQSFNGECVRLDDLQMEENGISLDLSTVGFFDLVTTNLTFFPGNMRCANVWRTIASWPMLPKFYSIIRQPHLTVLGKVQLGFQDVLSNRHLANVLAVSTNLVDRKGRVLIIRRPTTITVSGGVFTVASTGTVQNGDLVDTGDKSSVFVRAAARELQEEIGVLADPDAFILQDIILTRQKYQPIAIIEATIEDLDAVHARLPGAEDFRKEAASAYVLDLNDVPTFFTVLGMDMSPASAYSLELAFRNHHRISEKEFQMLAMQHYRLWRRLSNYWLCRAWLARSKVMTTS